MKKNFRAWPQSLFLDTTYKLVIKGFPFLIINGSDSNNYTHIFACGLLADEKADTLTEFFQCFINSNPDAAQQVTSIMTDKDLTERPVLKTLFPNASLRLCIFHTCKTFEREVTPSKMNTTKDIADKCLQYLDTLVKTPYKSVFEEYYKKFLAIAPPKLLAYYEKNWNCIKEEWAVCFKLENSWGDFTDNRTESLNAKIKQAMRLLNKLVDFIHNFFVWYNVREDEYRHKLRERKNKYFRPNIYPRGSPEFSYLNILTDHAFAKIEPEIQMRSPLTMKKSGQDGIYIGLCDGMEVKVTSETCQCPKYLIYKLPCRHIFNLREKLNLDLFSKDICNPRYLSSVNLALQPLLEKRKSASAGEKQFSTPACHKVQPKTLNTVQDRYNDLIPVMSSLHNQASMYQFSKRKVLFEKLDKHLRRGDEIDITVVKRGNYSNLPCKINEDRFTDDSINRDFSNLNVSAIELPEDIQEAEEAADNVMDCTRRFSKRIREIHI